MIHTANMNQDNATNILCELGHSTRFSVFRLLVKAGDKGLVVGDIQQHLDISGPTLSHHIRRLTSVGLVKQNREGRSLYCVAQLDAFRDVMSYLEDECCTL